MPASPEPIPPGLIEDVRRFNRVYTARIGVLQEHFLGSPFTLTEVRVLYELAHRDDLTASQLASELALDPGYLSRILRHFESRGYLDKRPSETDRRQRLLQMTAKGRKAYEPLNALQRESVADLVRQIPPGERQRAVAALRSLARALDPAAPHEPLVLRGPRAGELGWVVQRHGALYAQEYGWDERFEGLVARIVSDYAAKHDPKREGCWIAERAGEILGSVFLVEKSQTVAQLRLLLVEPTARGQGVGTRLVRECISFARHAGYRKLVLWTNDVLRDARRIYQREGFLLVEQEKHRAFGPDLTSQTWELDLTRIDEDAMRARMAARTT